MNKFLRRKLENGITVIMERRDLPLVSLSISNQFGAEFEKSEIKGIAHVIEHLLFTGTKKRTHEDISREIEKKGGVLNAYTDHGVTSYWFKLPSEHIFAGLDILTDMLNNTIFKEDKFEKEKKVILEEIKMYHDDPRSHAFEQLEKNLYEKPFGETVIGNKESVSGLKRDFVVSYFKEVYNPENYIVTIVGNADFEKICTYLEKNFAVNKAKPKPIEIKKRYARTVETRNDIDQAHIVFGMHAPLPSEKEFIALDVLDGYLANGMSSRLFLEIREKRGLAYAVKSIAGFGKNYSHYMIYIGTTKEALKEVEKIIVEEFSKINDMTEKDLNESKERVIGLKRVVAEDSADVMNNLLFNELTGKAEEYYSYEEKIKEVSLDQVKKLAKELIKNYSTAAVTPK